MKFEDWERAFFFTLGCFLLLEMVCCSMALHDDAKFEQHCIQTDGRYQQLGVHNMCYSKDGRLLYNT
jgi:hypothetical protein